MQISKIYIYMLYIYVISFCVNLVSCVYGSFLAISGVLLSQSFKSVLGLFVPF